MGIRPASPFARNPAQFPLFPFEIPLIHIDRLYILRYSNFVFWRGEIGFSPLSSPPLAPQHSLPGRQFIANTSAPKPLPQPLQNQHFPTLPYQRKSTRLKTLSFDSLAHSFAESATQLPINQSLAHSLLKTRGWVGGTLSHFGTRHSTSLFAFPSSSSLCALCLCGDHTPLPFWSGSGFACNNSWPI